MHCLLFFLLCTSQTRMREVNADGGRCKGAKAKTGLCRLFCVIGVPCSVFRILSNMRVTHGESNQNGQATPTIEPCKCPKGLDLRLLGCIYRVYQCGMCGMCGMCVKCGEKYAVVLIWITIL